MSADNRRAKRRQISQTVEVVDAMTEASIGRIVNLSPGGMLMIANTQMMDDALFQFRFVLTDAAGHDRAIDVGAHQLWSDGAGAPGQLWAGFRFIDVRPDDAAFLAQWVEAPGSRHV